MHPDLQPDLRPVKESGRLYRLMEDYSYTLSLRPLQRVKIEQGFQTDGLSAWRFAALIGLGRDGIHRAAVLVHDFLYVRSGRLTHEDYEEFHNGVWCGQYKGFSREDADLIFLQMLERAGVKSFHKYVAYYAVRLFGRFYW